MSQPGVTRRSTPHPARILPILALACTAALAQAPSTDIFVVTVEDGRPGQVRRVTDRDGYDNQPQFLADGRRLVYSSFGQEGTDIVLVDLVDGRRRIVVNTAESEYSPTPVPGENAISVVRDYGELKQQLWSFPLGAGEPRLLLPDVNPVGYHAWIDARRLVLFVLGETHTLQVATVGPGPGTVVAEHPGRALALVPGGTGVSFVDKSTDDWWLTELDPDDGARRRLVLMRPGREDYAWAPDGAVWAGDGSRLYRWRPGDDGWRLAGDLAAHGIAGITRLAFSPDGTWLAIVADR